MSAKPSTQDKKEIIVPAMGESVSEATVARWMKKAGDRVEIDEPLIELETDKVTLEVGAPQSGILTDLQVKEGDTVTVGTVVGFVGEGGASITSSPAEKPAEKFAEKPITPSSSSSEPLLAPSVRKMVAEHHLDPALIGGNGKDGRITKGDVLNFLDKPHEIKTPSAVVEPRDLGPREERVRMTRLRQRIAERLKQAQETAAILTTFNEVDMTNVMELRTRMKDVFEKKHGVKLGFMSFFVQACLVALKEVPAVNAEIEGQDIIFKNHYDIGVAVGTPQGLVVPVLRNADQLGFAQTEQAIGDLGKKARDGKLSMDDMTGGTFTISNGGVYGSLMSTPILNPPQSGILGMHKIEQRPRVMPDGSIQARPMMYLALSYDHRIIDGKEAVTFLVRVKECIEDPERMLLNV